MTPTDHIENASKKKQRRRGRPQGSAGPPMYRSVEESLRLDIRRGRWGEGNLMPGRLQLAREFNVSLGTIERAVTSLLADGTLETSGTRGTFVKSASHQDRATQEDASLPRPPVLGIVARTIPPDQDQDQDLFYWTRLVVDSLEQSYLGGTGTALGINVYNGPAALKTPIPEAVRSLRNDGAGAVALVDIHDNFPEEELEQVAGEYERSPYPIVHITQMASPPSLPSVLCDIHNAGGIAVRHLVDKGHRRLHIVAPIRANWVESRIRSALDTARKLGIPNEDVTVIGAPDQPLHDLSQQDTSRAGYEAGLEIFARPDPPTAIFAINDYVAYGLIDAAKERRKQVGRDYLIVGVDDAQESFARGLTSIRPPIVRMGEEASLLLKRLLLHPSGSVDVHLQPSLIVRASSRFSLV